MNEIDDRFERLIRHVEALEAKVADLSAAQRDTARQVDFLVRFLEAARGEIRRSWAVRGLRRLMGGGAPAPEAAPAAPAAAGTAWSEDFVRVYPDGRQYDPAGNPREFSEADRRNYLNHVKFYRFAAQFAPGRAVLDMGCGSGYGCSLLADAGATRVTGCDLSEHAIRFAKEQYGARAQFLRQSCTDLRDVASGSFDLVVCSEVLEHLQEHDEVEPALREMVRVARPGALFVLATPNLELLEGHGFDFGVLHAHCAAHFRRFAFFENALVPFAPGARAHWEERRAAGRTGIVVQEELRPDETVLPDGAAAPLAKSGRPPALESFEGLSVDTRLLHNTHSFVIVAAEPR